MSDVTITVNGEQKKLTDQDPATPLLWVLRDELGLLGTKFGCGPVIFSDTAVPILCDTLRMLSTFLTQYKGASSPFTTLKAKIVVDLTLLHPALIPVLS